MIKIYGSKRSSAFRCVWVAEEINLPYEIVELDFQKGEHKSAEYLKINPNGKVPTMTDGEFVLWESLAICYYMLEKQQNPELVGTTPAEHGIVNQWSLWALLHLYGNAFAPLVYQKFRGTPENETTKSAREVELPRFLSVLEERLNGRDFVALDHFSLADLVIMSVVGSAEFISLDLTTYPNIVRWMTTISARPAYIKARA